MNKTKQLIVFTTVLAIAGILLGSYFSFDSKQGVNVSLNDNDLIACTKEAKICPDGSAVGRNSRNNCEFFPCPEGPISEVPEVCTDVVTECEDGTMLTNSCQTCPDNTNQSTSSRPAWKVTPLPPESEDTVFCPADVRVCANGATVSRQGTNCEFAKCTEEVSSGNSYDNLWASQPACRADFNRNGQVGFDDLSKFAFNFFSGPETCEEDLIGDDCEYDISDLQVFASIYNQTGQCEL